VDRAALHRAGQGLLLGCGRGLDALSLGEDGAASLGTDLAAVQLRVLLGVAIGVGARWRFPARSALWG
jgi:ABC-type Fe3+-siderophore transport system permease subunit